MKNVVFFFLPLLLHLLGTSARLLENPAACSNYEAIYQFGDSLADTGNGGCYGGSYGRTYFHHATGRCSDGRLMIDFFAQTFGFPLLDPYLGKNGNFSHGANFAVAGATALNMSTLAAKKIYTSNNSSLLVQIDWFKCHLRTICTSPSECESKLGKALFLMGEIGGNDYYYAAVQSKSTEELYAFVTEVVQTISIATKEVIGLGAKQIMVPGNFPVGCMPIYLEKFRTDDPDMYDELDCLKDWNDYASFQNDHLQLAIKNLQKEHPDVVITYLDYFSAMTSMLKEASSLGFDKNELLKACCGCGNNQYNYNPSRQCGSKGVLSCPDPNKRISWDGIHLTEHANQLMADRLLPYIMTPATVQTA